jgi:hypothetical protein
MRLKLWVHIQHGIAAVIIGVGMKVGGLYRFVDGALVVLVKHNSPPLKVPAKLMRYEVAVSWSVACSEHVVKFSKKESGRHDGEAEQRCLVREGCDLSSR